jgi:uncharacterized membrane protein
MADDYQNFANEAWRELRYRCREIAQVRFENGCLLHRIACLEEVIADLENQLDIANAKLAKAEGGGSTPFEEIEW